MIFTSNPHLLGLAGLVYALAGAGLLAHSVFLTNSPVAAATRDDDRFSLRRRCEQWLDARIGAVLLVLGFFLQAVGTAGTATMNSGAAIVLLVLAFGAAYYGLTRDLHVDDLMGTGAGASTAPRELAPPPVLIAHSPAAAASAPAKPAAAAKKPKEPAKTGAAQPA